mmetsp:Transcript_50742/g.123020  ORF Transcript_50742/g.123020 Transcript_50742/m.123020 type:complete len:429 (-) Transcript_50742:111-1397(-)
MPSYGTADAAARRGAAPVRRRTLIVMAVAAVAVLACVVRVSRTGAGGVGIELVEAARTTQLAGPGYVKWLKTLKGPVDYQTGKEHDDKFESSGMTHMDVTDLVPSALPGSKRVGEMQGEDFARDVSASMAAPVDRDEINKLPMKLQALVTKMKQERKMVDELQTYVGQHSLAQPESLVVHVGQRGPTGARGARGPRGPTGDQGTKGPTGKRGPTGEKGRRGSQGPQGPMGKKGRVGPIGRTGYPGPPGPRGEVGIEGPEGPPGFAGPKGARGPPGMQGPNGGNGQEGATGLAGMQGMDGPRKTIWCMKTIGNTCYSGVHGRTNFYHAERVCAHYGGTLATFTTPEELKVSEQVFGKHHYWIGYKKVGGQWKNVDGRPNTFAQSRWHHGWPHGYAKCGLMYHKTLLNIPCHHWHLFMCSTVLPKGSRII